MDKLTGIISSAELLGGQIVGMRGLKGDKGDKGDTGESATIAVGTVTTGDAGTDASVVNVGDNHDAVFNFTIPKGDKGDTGATGDVNTYIAEYGTATYAEIGSAISDGKYVVAQYNNDYYPLIMFSNSSYVFSYIHENICHEVVCDSYSTWTARTHTSVRDVKQNGASVTTSGVALVTVPTATSTTPKMDGTASAGSETTWAKGDHIHPSDTSKADVGHTHTKSDVTDFPHTHTKSDITDFPTLATVATSGDYDDLTDKPSIHNVPSGGTKGQVLTKDSSTDYDASWANPEVTNAFLEQVLPTDSASGSVASFPDGTDLFPALSVVADINPIQDLHGYDAPWVGGAGKNKIPPFSTDSRTTGGITFTQNADGTVTANGTATETVIWREQFTFAGGRYIVSGGLSSNNFFGIQNSDSTYVARSFGSDSSAFDLTAGTYFKTVRIGNGETVTNAVFKPMMRLSTVSDATYAPYENICPISGHDDVTVTVADDVDNPTVSEDYTTTLPSTTYGGTLDLVSGVLTVTYASADLGDYTWAKITNAHKTFFQTSSEVADMKKSAGNAKIQPILCSQYKAETWAHSLDSNAYDCVICEGWANKSYIAIADSTKVNLDAASFKTAMNGVQLVYELATPQTYQLTPQQIQTLLGQNNVWADTGDVSVKYVADTKLYIDTKIQELNVAILALA